MTRVVAAGNGRVTKRCTSCGVAGEYRPRERRCKQIVRKPWTKKRYWCYGTLVKLVVKKITLTPEAQAWALVEHYGNVVTAKEKAIRRLQTSMDKAEKKYKYYKARAERLAAVDADNNRTTFKTIV